MTRFSGAPANFRLLFARPKGGMLITPVMRDIQHTACFIEPHSIMMSYKYADGLKSKSGARVQVDGGRGTAAFHFDLIGSNNTALVKALTIVREIISPRGLFYPMVSKHMVKMDRTWVKFARAALLCFKREAGPGAAARHGKYPDHYRLALQSVFKT